MKKEIINKILLSIEFLEANKNRLIIDADTHISDLSALNEKGGDKYKSTPNYYHGRPISAEDLLKEMKMADVDMSLVWQNPASITYTDNVNENFAALLNANKYVFNTMDKYPQKFIPAGWTDPKALGIDRALELTEILVCEFGFPIIKMNPAQNAFPIDGDEVDIILRKIVELGAVPAFHYGSDTPYTPPSGLEKLAVKNPDSVILSVHMGGGGAGFLEAENQYIASRELGLKYSNIGYILSAKRDTHIESDLITFQLAGEPYSKNLFCASDAPYGRQTWNFGGFRAMFKSLIDGANHTDERVCKYPGLFDERVMQNYLGGNFAAFAIKAYKNVLAKS